MVCMCVHVCDCVQFCVFVFSLKILQHGLACNTWDRG